MTVPNKYAWNLSVKCTTLLTDIQKSTCEFLGLLLSCEIPWTPVKDCFTVIWFTLATQFLPNMNLIGKRQWKSFIVYFLYAVNHSFVLCSDLLRGKVTLTGQVLWGKETLIIFTLYGTVCEVTEANIIKSELLWHTLH